MIRRCRLKFQRLLVTLSFQISFLTDFDPNTDSVHDFPMSAPIPVILCGAMRPVAALVRSHMLLEYDGMSSHSTSAKGSRTGPLTCPEFYSRLCRP